MQTIAKLATQELAVSVDPVQTKDLHDRKLRVYDWVLHLDPSANNAGEYATNFNPRDSTAHGSPDS